MDLAVPRKNSILSMVVLAIIHINHAHLVKSVNLLLQPQEERLVSQAKESTRLISKRSALARVRAWIEEPTESDERQVNEPPNTCEELRKTNELLAKLISQVSKTQRHVAALEEKLDTSISSSTSSGSSKKRSKSVDVPNVVRVSLFINHVKVNASIML